MKVLLYAKNEKIVSRSGVGRAMSMQKNALKSEQVELTCDPREDFDIVHLNTVFPSDYHMAKKAKREGKKVVYHAHSTKEDFRNSFVGSNLTAPLFKWWIMKCYQIWKNKEILPRDWDKIKQYSRRNQVQILLDYLSNNLATSG